MLCSMPLFLDKTKSIRYNVDVVTCLVGWFYDSPMS